VTECVNLDELIGLLRAVLDLAKRTFPDDASALEHELDVTISLLDLDVAEARTRPGKQISADSFGQFISLKERVQALGQRFMRGYEN
jgi:hypothetical protein